MRKVTETTMPAAATTAAATMAGERGAAASRDPAFKRTRLLEQLHPEHAIALHHALDHVHAARHAGEDGVATVEMWLRRMRDEPLAAAGVLAGKRHAHHAGLVAQAVVLAADGVARPAGAGAGGITVLDHEVGHHAVHGEPVEVAARGQPREVLDRLRRLAHVKGPFDLARGGV